MQATCLKCGGKADVKLTAKGFTPGEPPKGCPVMRERRCAIAQCSKCTSHKD